MRILAVSALTLAFLFQGCAARQPQAQLAWVGSLPLLKVGSPAPEFSAQTLDGKHVSLSSYHGKTLLVLFSTTWCGPCQAETADVIRSYRKLGSDRVAFLRVDPEEKEPTVRAFTIEYGEPYPVALDPKGSIASLGYDSGKAFPTAYVIDPNGIVRGSFLRTYQYADYIAAAEKGRTFVTPTPPVMRSLEAQLAPQRFTFKGNERQVIAQITAAQAKISSVDAKMPKNGDYHDLMKHERVLQQKMIAALTPVAKSTSAKKMLLNLRMASDENQPMGGGVANNRDEISIATALLAMDPSDEPSAWHLMTALASLHRNTEALKIAKQFEARHPNAKTYEDLSWAYEVNQDIAHQALWDTKILNATEKLTKTAPTDTNLTNLEEQARGLANLESQLGHAAQAKQLYQLALNTIAKIKKPSPYIALDIQNAQLGELALGLSGTSHATDISLAPWTGAPLPGSVANTIKYRLVVVAQPGTTVRLSATHFANGWLPSFCTDSLCSPLQRTIAMPDAGAKIVEFQMIPNDPAASPVSAVTILASGNGSKATASVISRKTS